MGTALAAAAILGAALVAGALLGVIVYLAALRYLGVDDGYRYIGEPTPPPPRTSPFARRPRDGASPSSGAAGEVKS